MRKFNFLCLFIFFSFANLAYSLPEMWMLVSAKATYDREMFPEDFERSFTNPEEWDESLRYMDAYFFSNSAAGHSFLTTEFYRIESWHKYPWTILPEDSTTSQPLTKVFLDISKTIKGTLIFPERSIEDTNADLTIDINDIKEVIKTMEKLLG